MDKQKFIEVNKDYCAFLAYIFCPFHYSYVAAAAAAVSAVQNGSDKLTSSTQKDSMV